MRGGGKKELPNIHLASKRKTEELRFRPDKDYDPLLDIYHNTRHASPRHQWLTEKEGWHLRSPWLSRFDWILDVHLEATYQPNPSLFLTKQRDIPRTVFVKAGHINLFIQEVLPAIKQTVIVYIGNGNVLPSEYLEDLQQLVAHPMVHQIFCENKDVEMEELRAMPMGIHPRQMLLNNAVVDLRALALQINIEVKNPKVFGAWGPKHPSTSAWQHRDEARNFMEEHQELCHYHEPLPLKRYWQNLCGYQFMFSPLGDVPDSSKTFEALILKTIPIVMAGPYAEAYRDLPVVVIEHLEEITSANLERWWEVHSKKFKDMSFASSDFWWRKIKAAWPPRKKAFLVLGPESHGNHLMTDLLIHAGCAGRSGHSGWRNEEAQDYPVDEQPWDSALPIDQDPIVWRRSVPHLYDWPDIKGMVHVLEERDYTVQAIVMTRDRYAALQSQLKWHHIDNIETGQDNIERSYLHIFKHVKDANIPYLMANYESLVIYPQSQDRLLEELGLEIPVVRFETWDGNTKWYPEKSSTAHRTHRQSNSATLSAIASEFPDHWFACSIKKLERYQSHVEQGKLRMKAARVVFCGIARDVSDDLPVVKIRIERAGCMFQDYRVVVFENDSLDSTLELLKVWQAENEKVVVLSETLGAKKWGQVRDLERMQHLATCRNHYLSYAQRHFSEFDYMIVMDLDLPKGFSFEGLANTFGHNHWDVVGSNGLLVPLHDRPCADPMFFDAWAFRREGKAESHASEEVNRLSFRRGEEFVPVWSCFGGLAVYRMEGMRAGAQYEGGDCEHVVFHRRLREEGFGNIYLNPSQIVLYAGKE